LKSAQEPFSKKHLLTVNDNHSLHSRSKDIKDFLSSLTYDKKSLIIYQIPIAYSSREQKNQLTHFEQSQERGTLANWTRQPLGGATCRIGLFTTWLDTWVGRTKQFQKESLHVWAAVLTWEKSKHGKHLTIYDSNSDLFSKEEITTKDLFLGKQRELIRYLIEKEKYKIVDIWVGGKGNTDQGICLEVTANWVQEVAQAGGVDIDNLKRNGFKRVEM
jgi:hypothetical protein